MCDSRNAMVRVGSPTLPWNYTEESMRQRTMELSHSNALETTPGSMGEEAMELPRTMVATHHHGTTLYYRIITL